MMAAAPPPRKLCNISRGSISAASWRGVNLGGWLVLEQWMSPGLFEACAPGAVDERSLFELGGDAAREAVERFRREFITEHDFRWLREVGRVNAVRLPLGFWCMDQHARGTPHLSTQSFVDKVFDWAERHGLGVVLDMHAAIGSQNGQHHSGQCGGIEWLQGGNRERNLAVLAAWAARWGRRGAFLGLGLGNEVAAPAGCESSSSGSSSSSDEEGGLGASGSISRWLAGGLCCSSGSLSSDAEDYWSRVVDFYAEASQLCRPFMHHDAVLVVDVCWDTRRWKVDDLAAIEGPLLLDYHHYECMGDARARPVQQHCRASDLDRALREAPPLPMILGEFSLALKPRCAGFHDREWQRQFFERQTLLASEHGAGWFFFNYKVAREGWAHWSYREGVERGWIPTPRYKLTGGHDDDSSSTADTKGEGPRQDSFSSDSEVSSG
mmetsp:Transcript_47277/g.137617  ORF Transcript_47277/g.137617 Transcript_47277/m.137617 type:complete len:438 (+) Transcript_47277:116-1429(+)